MIKISTTCTKKINKTIVMTKNDVEEYADILAQNLIEKKKKA